MWNVALTPRAVYHRLTMEAAAGTDEELYARYRDARDEESLGALVRRHWDRLFGLAWRVLRDPALAEDAAQQAFVTLARSRAYRGEGPLAAWLAQVAFNEARKVARSERRRAGRELAVSRSEQGHAGPEVRSESDVAVAVEEHVSRLPEELRVPLLLRYVEGFTHADDARTLGLASGTASSRLRRGLERLRESLVGAGYAVALPSLAAIEGLLERPPKPVAAPEAPSGATVAELAARATARAWKLLAAWGGAAAVVVASATVGYVAVLRSGPAAPSGGERVLAQAGSVEKSPTGASVPVPVPGAEAGADERRGAAEGQASAPAGASDTLARDAAEEPDAVVLLEGVVVSAADGSPVEGARVIARKGKGTSYRTTDPNGQLAIELHPADLSSSVSLVLHRDDMEPLAVALSPEDLARRDPLRLVMKPGGYALEGRVVDEDGKPMPDVWLSVRQQYGLPESHRAEYESSPLIRRGPAGEFRVPGLAAGKAEVGLHQGLEVVAWREFPVGPETGPVEVRVPILSRLVLEAVDPDGRPLPRVHARIAGHEVAHKHDTWRARLDAGKLRPGTYQVSVARTAEALDAGHGTHAEVTLVRSRTLVERLVVLDGPPALGEPEPTEEPVADGLAGRVVTTEGTPIEGASATFRGVEVETDDAGRFAFEGLSIAALGGELLVEEYPYEPKRLAIQPGAPADRLVIELEDLSLAVFVRVPADSYTPDLPDYVEATLVAEAPDRRWCTSGGRAEFASGGRVRVCFEGEGARGARGTILIRFRGGGGLIVKDIVAGEPAPDVDLPDGPAGEAHGRVLKPDGRPAAGARAIVLFGDDPSFPGLSPWEERTGEDGALRLRDLPTGRLTVRVSAEGCAPRIVELEARGGEPVDLGDIRLDPAPPGE